MEQDHARKQIYVDRRESSTILFSDSLEILILLLLHSV